MNSGLVVASKHPIVTSAYHRFEASVGDELLAEKDFYEVLLAPDDASRIVVYATPMHAHLGEANAAARGVVSRGRSRAVGSIAMVQCI